MNLKTFLDISGCSIVAPLVILAVVLIALLAMVIPPLHSVKTRRGDG